MFSLHNHNIMHIRQRKVWSRLVDNLFGSLDLDKAEWLDEIEKGDSSLKAFLAMVEESIGEREREKFVEGLNSKVKLTLYKCFWEGGSV